MKKQSTEGVVVKVVGETLLARTEGNGEEGGRRNEGELESEGNEERSGM